MAKAQGKKTAAAGGGKSAAKKAVARVKSAASAAKKKVVPAKKAAAPKPKAAPKKAAAPKTKPKPKPKAAKKPVAAKVKAAAKAVKKTVAKAAAKPAKVIKAAVKPSPAKKAVAALPAKPKAVPPPAPEARKVVAPVVPPVPKPAPAAEEKKRGRRARPRVTSSGVPTAAWLSTEKPRPASFIPAPPRAEAPSAIAAPPASSDRLIRTEDLTHSIIRTVPVRIDVEQGQGRFHIIPNPIDAQVRAAEAIEWDFRYIGGADFSVEEIVIEFEKPAPFAQAVYKTKKPGGARPHRQVTAGVTGTAGKTYSYSITAMTPFKTVLVTGKGSVTIV